MIFIIDLVLTPVLMTKKELEEVGNILRSEQMENGNYVAFKDNYVGRERRFVTAVKLENINL